MVVRLCLTHRLEGTTVGQQKSEVADVGPTEKGTALVGHYPWSKGWWGK